jgi:ribose 1,5-bisphosphokinase
VSSDSGRLVLIVGPSGSGKDTLLRLAKAVLAGHDGVVFAPRIVTRPEAAEGEMPMSPSAFADAAARGMFAFTWHAHGLDYAIPGAIETELEAGRTVVLNVSRTIVPTARAYYRSVTVVLIDAPADVRAARVAARGREPPDAVAARIQRAPDTFSAADADIVILNTGTPLDGATALVRGIVGV